MREATRQTIDDGHDGIAIRHRQRTARAEIVLHVDDDEQPVVRHRSWTFRSLVGGSSSGHHPPQDIIALLKMMPERGQNMTDGRARDTLEAGKNQVVQSDNGPVLVNTRSGAGKVINGPDGLPLPGVTKPLNDGQSKALLFGSRMREADKILGTLSGEGRVTSVPGSRTPLVGGLVNALSGDNNQMLNQAKTDFMTAVLRRESGAAISSGEFETADKQYFPQIGDNPKVIAQKSANRQLAMKGILMEVPEKQRNSLQPTQQGVSSSWEPPKSGVIDFGSLK